MLPPICSPAGRALAGRLTTAREYVGGSPTKKPRPCRTAICAAYTSISESSKEEIVDILTKRAHFLVRCGTVSVAQVELAGRSYSPTSKWQGYG